MRERGREVKTLVIRGRVGRKGGGEGGGALKDENTARDERVGRKYRQSAQSSKWEGGERERGREGGGGMKRRK